MKVVYINKKSFSLILIFLISLLTLAISMRGSLSFTDEPAFVIGGLLQECQKENFNLKETLKNENSAKQNINEKYFRPSKLPALNNKTFSSDFYFEYYEKKPSEIILPDELVGSPDDTAINYFSILREAENITFGKSGGCGTIGWSRLSYPVAYNFLTLEYKKKLSYEEFLESFRDIGHINLIKIREIPDNSKSQPVFRSFFEIETIEGADKPGTTYFAYYYGFIEVQKEDQLFKISDIKVYSEDFLCAAYHGWHHMAEAVVDTVYGGWCKLAKKRYPTQQTGYIKNILVDGTDGRQYRFEFFQLANGTDIEIEQYVKTSENQWKPVDIDVQKCLKKIRNENTER